MEKANKATTTTGKRLQQKADDIKDEKIVKALLNADISGLSRDEAKIKLRKIIDRIENSEDIFYAEFISSNPHNF